MKKVGILGGMGPQASFKFYELLINRTKQKFINPRNQDYPYALISNIPVPDLINSLKLEKLTISMVNNAAKDFEKIGVDFIVMICNTMHLFQEQIMNGVGVKFISMIDCVIDIVVKNNFKNVGILGSGTTLQSGLYTIPLSKKGINVISPDPNYYGSISDIISNYISGNLQQEDIDLIFFLCDELNKKGVDAIILGCTELPLVAKDFLKYYNFIIPNELLADKVMEELGKYTD